MRMFKRGVILLGLIGVVIWALNSNLFVTPDDSITPRLLSHRGVHQTHSTSPRGDNTCTARHIDPPTHGLIENTIPSMRAAVDHGADVIELDVHLTPDNVFAVFHDWTVDCRTNGTGVTEKLPFAQLRALDIGHGYTRDGVNFPLRGTGVGLMPSLQEVLKAQLGARYLVNFKSRNAQEGAALARLLDDPGDRAQIWGVYGGEVPTRAAMDAMPSLRGFDKASLKACLIRYAALGWSGHVPQACRDTLVAVPLDLAPYLWGWPHRFTQRMTDAGSQVILWGPYDGSGFSSGIDDLATLAQVPAGFDGHIWTNKIEIIGPAQARP